MKNIFLGLILLLVNIASNAAEKPVFQICKQKQIPFEVSSHFAQNLLQVKLKAESPVTDFAILRVRGIDGVVVNKFQEISNLILNTGETAATQIDISNLTGLAYVVLEVEYRVNGVLNKKNVPISLGSLSAAQEKERKKHIKTIKTRKHSMDLNGNSKAVPQTATENVHYMKID